jgi:cell division septal protein FtsQ
MSDKNYKSSNLIRRKKKTLLVKVWLFSILGILIIGGSAFFSNSGKVKISSISVNDTVFFDKTEIEKIARAELEGSLLWVFAKNNILLLPRKNIEKKIKEYNQSIKTATLSLSGTNSISINVEEYKTTAIWCLEENCYYLNEEGIAFVKAPQDYDRNLVKFSNLIEGDPIGKTYSNSENFKKIINLINLFTNVPLKIVSVKAEDGVTFSLYTDTNMKILYEGGDDPEEVANNLNTIIEKDAISKSQLINIDYIDLRFGNKVYYKIR